MPEVPRRFGFPRPIWIVLATVVLIVAALGLRFGLPIYRQQVAIREIERLGGRVETVRWPEWLGDRVGVERRTPLDRVEDVWLDSSQVTDAGLIHLKGLAGLKTLGLYRTVVTDAGLVHLNGLMSLQNLDLTGTQVTDAGLMYLKDLTGLQGLYLSGTQITDAGLVHLKGLVSLQTLELAGTHVTDVGLVHLKELTNLEVLVLTRTRVRATDAGVVDLKRALPKLNIFAE